MRGVLDRVAGYLVSGLSSTLGVMPSFGLRDPARLGRIVAALVPIRKRLVLENLSRSDLFPHDGAAVERTVAAAYGHQILNLIDFLRIPALRAETLERVVEVHGLEHFEHALEAGRGAILLTAHIGCWELMGATLALRGVPLSSLIRVQSGAFNEAVNRIRTSTGNRLMDRNRAAVKILRALRENRVVGIVADQHTDNAGVEIDFLGRRAMANAAPVHFALRTGAPLIPGFIRRRTARSGPAHEIRILPPLGLEVTGDLERDLRENTRRAHKAIENAIRRDPAQWFWFHNRWRGLP